METRRGELDVHVRALDGFPDEQDRTFGADACPYAIVAIVVRLIPTHEAASPRFLYVRRALSELLELETRVALRDRHTTSIAESVAQYEAALLRPRFGAVVSQTERLLVQLEIALTHLLSSSSLAAVKRFFGCLPVRSAEAATLVEQSLAARASDPAIEEEAIVGGGSVDHDVRVDARASRRVVVWKFSFAGDAVDFSVVFTPNEDGSKPHDMNGEEMDPYSEAALAWHDRDHASSAGRRADERVVLQYTTRYDAAQQRDGATTVPWIYGACRVPDTACGVVSLKWTDVGEATIFSKALHFQTRVCGESDSSPDEWSALSELLTTDEESVDSYPLVWLEAMLMSSTERTWPVESTGTHLHPLEEPFQEDFATVVVSNETAQAQDLRIRELEGKVFNLEEELLAVRKELKTAKSEIEISSEIYKASLETIAHLETAPARNPGRQPRVGEPTSRADDDSDDADSYGDADADGDYGSDEEEAEQEPADGETDRLRDLVATFQEQCLWRSIETSESEKRNLLLEAELNQLDQEKQSLANALATRDQELATLRAETHKLKTQKAVLLKEVKRLQPYSQANLSELIREAEEARMMQRSLQAQLQALVAATNTPETDHPVV